MCVQGLAAAYGDAALVSRCHSELAPSPASRITPGKKASDPSVDFRTKLGRLAWELLAERVPASRHSGKDAEVRPGPSGHHGRDPKGSMQLKSIYLGPKVFLWEPLWAPSIYYIPTWTLSKGRQR